MSVKSVASNNIEKDENLHIQILQLLTVFTMKNGIDGHKKLRNTFLFK